MPGHASVSPLPFPPCLGGADRPGVLWQATCVERCTPAAAGILCSRTACRCAGTSGAPIAVSPCVGAYASSCIHVHAMVAAKSLVSTPHTTTHLQTHTPTHIRHQNCGVVPELVQVLHRAPVPHPGNFLCLSYLFTVLRRCYSPVPPWRCSMVLIPSLSFRLHLLHSWQRRPHPPSIQATRHLATA